MQFRLTVSAFQQAFELRGKGGPVLFEFAVFCAQAIDQRFEGVVVGQHGKQVGFFVLMVKFTGGIEIA